MKTGFRRLVMLQILVGAVSLVMGLTASTETAFAAPEASCNQRILTFPAWYNGVAGNGKDAKGKSTGCEFQPKEMASGEKDPSGNPKPDLRATVVQIALNVIEIIIQIVGYATAIMIIIGGFNYMTAAGDSAKMSSAKNTITNAVVGLVIAIMSVAIVNFIAGAI